MAGTESLVWQHFTRAQLSDERATCNLCKKSYTCKGGTTSSLINHMKASHKEIHQKMEEEKKSKKIGQKRPVEETSKAGEPKAKQLKLNECMGQEGLNKAVDGAIVDFLADSGAAFRVVGLETFDKLMKTANRRIKLKHPKTYSRMIKIKAADMKQEIIDIFTTVKDDLRCAGFTTDMWTSASGDPFMSLTLHFIDKNWRLHRWTPYIAPFPASHTGKNISLGLDAMVEELGLAGPQWELFCVNDNAANVKLGIKLSRHLNQYLCDIHTLDLASKDAFKNTPGVTSLMKKTRGVAKFVKKSPTVAKRELKREAREENIPYRKLANPPRTRWNDKLSNLASVLHLKKNTEESHESTGQLAQVFSNSN